MRKRTMGVRSLQTCLSLCWACAHVTYNISLTCSGLRAPFISSKCQALSDLMAFAHAGLSAPVLFPASLRLPFIFDITSSKKPSITTPCLSSS